MDGPHETAAGAAVTTDGFGIRGTRGWAFRDIGFTAGPGSLVAVRGPSGSGRTCLLLALTGRMKPSEGTATVAGLRLPRQMAAVRRVSAPAHMSGVTDLEPALTVSEHLRERVLSERRFGGSPRKLRRSRAERAARTRERAMSALSASGLDPAALPKGLRTAVRDLDRLEALRLSIALALTGGPRLLAVDDVDLGLTDAERSAAWTLLASLTARGTTVLAVCDKAPEGALVVSTASPEQPSAKTPAAGSGPDTACNDPKETADALAETGRA